MWSCCDGTDYLWKDFKGLEGKSLDFSELDWLFCGNLKGNADNNADNWRPGS